MGEQERLAILHRLNQNRHQAKNRPKYSTRPENLLRPFIILVLTTQKRSCLEGITIIHKFPLCRCMETGRHSAMNPKIRVIKNCNNIPAHYHIVQKYYEQGAFPCLPVDNYGNKILSKLQTQFPVKDNFAWHPFHGATAQAGVSRFCLNLTHQNGV